MRTNATSVHDGNDEGRMVTAGNSHRAIAIWLLVCCALVFAMVVLGGVTRLTGSGLSMVAWEPVSGVLPPMSDAAWDAEFARYQASPEFRVVNHWMSVDDFKQIYWFEWAHRLLGRAIGVVFALPFLFFAARRRVDRWLAPRLVAMFVLGGLQGLLGWYMVKSGLVDDPHVSQYRLAAHLGLAVLVYVYMLWTALGLLSSPAAGAPDPHRRLRTQALWLGVFVFVTMMSGAFVAGLKAGHIYNTFPLMGDGLVPPGLYALEPALRNPFENPATAQFNHRVLAMLALAGTLALWMTARRRDLGTTAATWLHLVGAMVLVQFALGVATLLARVPVSLGAAHQAGALMLLTLLVGLAVSLKARGKASQAPGAVNQFSRAL
jgi:cytochrome c oxidase assembly protein subunit 15